MRTERTKNAVRNLTVGLLLKAVQLLMPFVMRTAMISLLGVAYLGLNSLFTSILHVLNLAELGVGSAMVYAMYRPVAENDTRTLCALMRLYRLYYRVIGGVVLALGLLLLPFLPRLIHGEVPSELNLYLLYLMNLAAAVASYWLFAYRNSILQAHQRVDLVSKATLLTDGLKYAAQLAVLFFLRDYYAYVLVLLLSQALNNLLIAVISHRKYPDCRPAGTLPRAEVRAINRNIRDLFTAKIGSVVVNSADTLVISAFLGLSVLAVYQNYYMLLTAVTGVISVFLSACTAGIGNSLILESREKNFADFQTLTFVIAWLAGFCTCCFAGLYQPFMELWMGESLMLEYPIVLCLCGYFFVYQLNRLLNLYKDASGMWHEDRFRPLVTAGTNLALNLILVRVWGLYGVVLSTVLSMLLVGMPWLLWHLFHVIFDTGDAKRYVGGLLYDVAVTGLVCGATTLLNDKIQCSPPVTIALRLLVCMVFSNGLFLLFYHRQPEFRKSLRLLRSVVNGKRSILKNELDGREPL